MEPRGDERLSPRLEAREARRAVHLRIPLEHEVARVRRLELFLQELALEPALEDDLERRDAVDVVLRVRDVVHVERLHVDLAGVRRADRLGKAGGGCAGRLPRRQRRDVDLLLEVLRPERSAIVGAERLEFLGADAQPDGGWPHRLDRIVHGGGFRTQAADGGQDADGRRPEADVLHQPFLSEIMSSTSSESRIRRSSSRAIRGTPRMLRPTDRRTTNITETCARTRLTSAGAGSPSRYSWIVRRETPAMSASVPRETWRSSRSRRSALESSRT